MSLFSSKETKNLTVSGMHCQKCVARVTEALQGVDGVTGVKVDLEGASAVVEGRHLNDDALVAAVKDAGFDAAVAA